MLFRLASVGRFSKSPSVDTHHGIAADDPISREADAHFDRFGLGKSERQLLITTTMRSLDWRFIDAGSFDLVRDAGMLEELPPDCTGGSEDQRHSRRTTLWISR